MDGSIFQSDVYCTLYICSGVGKDYRGEDQVLEIDRKVGEHFWSVLGGEKLAKLTRKIKCKKRKFWGHILLFMATILLVTEFSAVKQKC
jgi:hypothetical protein